MAQSNSFQLYLDSFWISPYAFSAYVALTEKGIPFETVEVARYQNDNRLPKYQKPSITGRIPALVHNGFWLAESSAIAEYIEDLFPSPNYPKLLPNNLKERARARMVMAWMRSDFMAIREERPTWTMFYERASKPLSSEGELAAKRLVEAALDLLPENSQTLFDGWSIADSDLAFMLARLKMNGRDLGNRLNAYVETQWSRPSVKSFADRKRPAYIPY
jgi:glutathione S-transferase